MRFQSAACGLIALMLAFGQPSRPSFEVASVKPAKTDESWFWDVGKGGRLVASNVTLKRLMMLAYHLQEYQIVGGPGWASGEQFDIEAKPETGANPTDEQSRQMLQGLLEERFQLQVRKETRESSVYVLNIFRNGPPRSADQTPPQPGPASAGGQMPRGAMRWGPGVASGVSVPISLLARFLGQTLGRPVVDKTGLAGLYDINLHWTPDQIPQNLPAGVPVSSTDGPSVFTALQEQVGLRLESGKGPVEVLVIERAEKPSEN